MREDIQKWIDEKYAGAVHRIRENSFIKQFSKEQCEELLKETEFASQESFPVRIRLYLKNIKSVPRCKNCDKNVSFDSKNDKFSTFCSNVCRLKKKESNEPSSKDKLVKENNSLINEKNINLIKLWLDKNWKGSTRFVKKNNFISEFGEDFYNEIIGSITFVKDIISKKVLCLINGITEQPKCQNCGVPVGFDEGKNEFRIYCSNKCRFEAKDISLERRKKTTLEKYGVENVFQSEKIKKKIVETNNEKYGTDHYCKTKDYKDRLESGDINNKFVYTQEMRRKTHRQTYDRFVERYKDVAIPMFSFDEYEGSGYSKVYKWKCVKCGKIYETWYNYGLIKKCPICYKHSAIEQFIIDFLTEKNVEFKLNDRQLIKPQELDFYIPSKGLAIEMNGVHWHSHLFKEKDYHLEKTKLCELKNIQLIHIFEDEVNHKPDIVKSRLSSILGISERTVYARKCEIRNIDSVVANNFYHENHLQGRCNSSINLGLFYNNELVFCLSFSKLRSSLGHKHIEGHYELTRVASKLNTSVVGGFSRLFKHFTKKYEFKKVLSYCDRRWSNGNFYLKNGFIYVKETKPNYWYITPCRSARLHRYGFRKSVLKEKLENFDSNLTEFKNMENHNYARVYDCGSYLFEYIKP